jgi:hypothetical protein
MLINSCFFAVFTKVNYRGFRKVRKPLFFASNWPFETKKRKKLGTYKKLLAPYKTRGKTNDYRIKTRRK